MIRISKDNTVFTRVFRNGEEFYALYKATANQNENTSNMNYSSFIRNINSIIRIDGFYKNLKRKIEIKQTVLVI